MALGIQGVHHGLPVTEEETKAGQVPTRAQDEQKSSLHLPGCQVQELSPTPHLLLDEAGMSPCFLQKSLFCPW